MACRTNVCCWSHSALFAVETNGVDAMQTQTNHRLSDFLAPIGPSLVDFRLDDVGIYDRDWQSWLAMVPPTAVGCTHAHADEGPRSDENDFLRVEPSVCSHWLIRRSSAGDDAPIEHVFWNSEMSSFASENLSIYLVSVHTT